MRATAWVMTDKVGSECTRVVEIDDEELEGLNVRQRDEVIEHEVHGVVHEMIEWGWREGDER